MYSPFLPELHARYQLKPGVLVLKHEAEEAREWARQYEQQWLKDVVQQG